MDFSDLNPPPLSCFLPRSCSPRDFSSPSPPQKKNRCLLRRLFVEWHSVCSCHAFEATRLRVTKYRTSTIDVNLTDIGSLRKHPFLLPLRRWGRFARNVPSGEERGETDVFAGYDIGKHLPVWFIFSIPPCKGVQDSSEFSIVRCGFCGSFSVKLRFWIPKVRGQTEWIPDSPSCITAFYALVDLGFKKQKFPGFRIPQAKFPRISLNEVILNANIFSQF